MVFKIKILTIVNTLFFSILIFNLGIAQEQKTHSQFNTEFITDQLENIAQSHENILDYSDLIDEYLYYSNNPVNLNGNNIEVLRDIYLINDIQLVNLKSYKHKFGKLLSIFELKSINGFEEETIKRLERFIILGETEEQKSLSLKNIFKFGRHELIVRADRILEPKKGYLLPSDSAINYPGSVYLGDQQHFYLRYSFNFKNSVRFGLTMDKDAGEVFIKSSLNDSLKKLIGQKTGILNDFLSAFAYAEDMGFLRNIIVGDYHLEFGQGLTLWSGLSFGKSAEALSVKKYARGIRPNTSANENRYFRGIAATLGRKSISFTPFVSKNSIDANLVPIPGDGKQSISSLMETGMHRTINEIIDKKSISIQVIGGNLSFSHSWFKTGITVTNTKLNSNFAPSDNAYNFYRFQSNEITNCGIDISLRINKLNLYGEISGSSTGGYAGIAGIDIYTNDRFFLTLLYHNYSKKYQNLYNNPFAESSLKSNESGLYTGLKVLVSKNINITGYIDHYRFPWLKYRVNSPSIGKDYLLQINYLPHIGISLYLRYRYKNMQENFNYDSKYIPVIVDVIRNELRFFISYSIHYNLTFKNRIDFASYNNKELRTEYGYLLYQDILYRPPSFPVEATFRFALFSTDSYNSRIYSYEHDVLHAFSIPSYYYSGQRWYLMLKFKLSSKLSAWLRYSRTTYYNRESIGSGNELINGNHKSEIKFEFKLKL